MVFDTSKINRAVPDCVCKFSMAQVIREAARYRVEHPETQVEDPGFDRWCDRIIKAQQAADRAFE